MARKQKSDHSQPIKPRLSAWQGMGLLFILALAVRGVALWQYARSPDFELLIGDSKRFLDQALLLLNGGHPWHGTVPFQSPFYPVLLAILLKLSGMKIIVVRMLQVVLGAANCVFLYQIGVRVFKKNSWAPWLAGVGGAVCGVIVFYDMLLLATTWVLLFVNVTVFGCIRFRETQKRRWLWLAGMVYGLAIVARTNLLLFLPVLAWFSVGHFSFGYRAWQLKKSLGLFAGVALVVLPMTLHNAIVAKDFVLLTSNFGINFYLGNNTDADGTFHIPKGSGLSNADLEKTQQQVASREKGRRLKPSEVSHFWFQRGLAFILHHPVQALYLYGQKAALLCHRQEIPNNTNYEYFRAYYITLFKYLPLSFMLIFPLAMIGLVGYFRTEKSETGILVLLFLGVYSLSMLPFFINSRYRLPLMPFLLLFAAFACTRMVEIVRERQWKPGVLLLCVGLAAWMFMNSTYRRHTYVFTRMMLAQNYARFGDQDVRAVEQRILEYKQILEVTPNFAFAAYALGDLLVRLGYAEKGEWVLKYGLTHDPSGGDEQVRSYVKQLEKEEQSPATASLAPLPETPYEQARALLKNGRVRQAQAKLAALIKLDPYHVPAYAELARLLLRGHDTAGALRVIRRGLWYNPQHPDLLEVQRRIYLSQGKRNKARAIELRLNRRSYREND